MPDYSIELFKNILQLTTKLMERTKQRQRKSKRALIKKNKNKQAK